MKNIRMASPLYIVREDCAKDLAARKTVEYAGKKRTEHRAG